MENYRHPGACLKAHSLFPQGNQEASGLGAQAPCLQGGVEWCLNTLVFLCGFLWKSERAEPVTNETVFSISVFPIRWWYLSIRLVGKGRGSDLQGLRICSLIS